MATWICAKKKKQKYTIGRSDWGNHNIDIAVDVALNNLMIPKLKNE